MVKSYPVGGVHFVVGNGGWFVEVDNVAVTEPVASIELALAAAKALGLDPLNKSAYSEAADAWFNPASVFALSA